MKKIKVKLDEIQKSIYNMKLLLINSNAVAVYCIKKEQEKFSSLKKEALKIILKNVHLKNELHCVKEELKRNNFLKSSIQG